jgi:uncharacterized protein YdaU (DUF1376 family)
MHYYQFNIGDYASHTAHLDPLEDVAYRRMLDYCYLNECGLPETVESIARVIRMRMHCECIATVLHEFFYMNDDGTWHHSRVDSEIIAYKGKSAKASESARKRWENADANALPTQCERNANHKPLTINQEPYIKPTSESKIPPCPVEKIISMYQDRCSRLPKLRVIPDKTRTAISSRWRQDTKFQTLDFWQSFFDYCNDNKFLSGQSNPRPGSDKPFRADLNWLVKPEPFANIINEKYA